MTEQTHFGVESLLGSEKTQRVKDVVRRVAKNYDLMNDLMSLGIHRLWKDHLIQGLDLHPNAHVLDVAGGTGDIAFRLLKTYPHLNLHITLCDLTPEMMEQGRDRAINQGILRPIDWVCANAEQLPVPDSSADLYLVAYGLRNVTKIGTALIEAARVLKPGGKFVCLEFSRMTLPPLQKLYDFYSFQFLPTLGEWIAQDRAAYQYLVESIRRFPDQESLAEMMRSSGFSTVAWENLCGGISCIHIGIKTA